MKSSVISKFRKIFFSTILIATSLGVANESFSATSVANCQGDYEGCERVFDLAQSLLAALKDVADAEAACQGKPTLDELEAAMNRAQSNYTECRNINPQNEERCRDTFDKFTAAKNAFEAAKSAYYECLNNPGYHSKKQFLDRIRRELEEARRNNTRCLGEPTK